MMFLVAVLTILYLVIGALIYSAAHKAYPEVDKYVLLIWILWPVFFIVEFIGELVTLGKEFFSKK